MSEIPQNQELYIISRQTKARVNAKKHEIFKFTQDDSQIQQNFQILKFLDKINHLDENIKRIKNFGIVILVFVALMVIFQLYTKNSIDKNIQGKICFIIEKSITKFQGNFFERQKNQTSNLIAEVNKNISSMLNNYQEKIHSLAHLSDEIHEHFKQFSLLNESIKNFIFSYKFAVEKSFESFQDQIFKKLNAQTSNLIAEANKNISSMLNNYQEKIHSLANLSDEIYNNLKLFQDLNRKFDDLQSVTFVQFYALIFLIIFNIFFLCRK